VSLQGIEFWTTVAEIELDLAVRPSLDSADNGSGSDESTSSQSKNYVMKSLEDLVPVLVKKLSEQEEYDDEEDWVPSKGFI
jgi:importin subunit beta-1